MILRARVCVVGITAATFCAALLVPATPAYASAPGLAISVPSSVSFGSFSAGARTITANLGTVTVETSSALAHDATWTATVSTTAFTTGGGSAAERVAAGSVTYLAGTATASSGFGVNACAPGQVTAASLSVSRTAFSCTGVSLSPSTSLSWNPQITIAVADSNVVGTYTGTITHSVV
ncbi:MAG: hypothetical protein JJD92_06950 [Frankiaceae bacterium]|nr:hypothetical protein [Frankiaceae bacterium]